MAAEELAKMSSCGLTVLRIQVGPQLVALYFLLSDLFYLKYALGRNAVNAPLAYRFWRHFQQSRQRSLVAYGGARKWRINRVPRVS